MKDVRVVGASLYHARKDCDNHTQRARFLSNYGTGSVVVIVLGLH